MNLLLDSKPMGKWDARFCELAKFVSEWSKDPNAKVGAVVFSKRGGDVSIGYNGFPMGVEDSAERLEDQETKLELVFEDSHPPVGPRSAAQPAAAADLRCANFVCSAAAAGPLGLSGNDHVYSRTGTRTDRRQRQ